MTRKGGGGLPTQVNKIQTLEHVTGAGEPTHTISTSRSEGTRSVNLVWYWVNDEYDRRVVTLLGEEHCCGAGRVYRFINSLEKMQLAGCYSRTY